MGSIITVYYNMGLYNGMEYSLEFLLSKLNFLFGQQSVGKEKKHIKMGHRKQETSRTLNKTGNVRIT